MSGKVIRAILNTPELNKDEKAVCVAIASHMKKETDHAWPGLDRIAYLSGVSRRTVQRRIDDLVRDGYLRIVKKATGRSSTHYGFIVASWCHPDTSTVEVSLKGRSGVRRAPLGRQGDTRMTEGMTKNDDATPSPMPTDLKAWRDQRAKGA